MKRFLPTLLLALPFIVALVPAAAGRPAPQPRPGRVDLPAFVPPPPGAPERGARRRQIRQGDRPDGLRDDNPCSADLPVRPGDRPK
jgi:hypothetical protein